MVVKKPPFRLPQTRKKQMPARLISPDVVAFVFDLECIRALAKSANIPGADLQKFGDGIREAILVYLRDAGSSKAGDEIRALYKAALIGDQVLVELAVNNLSPMARSILDSRAERQGLTFPAVHDPALSEHISKLCQMGGELIAGRNRPSGRRSVSWKPLIYAPSSQTHPAKRSAERQLVGFLWGAWRDSGGGNRLPAAVGDKPGPFFRLVQECLIKCGAHHVNAAHVINDVAKMIQSRPVPNF